MPKDEDVRKAVEPKKEQEKEKEQGKQACRHIT